MCANARGACPQKGRCIGVACIGSQRASGGKDDGAYPVEGATDFHFRAADFHFRATDFHFRANDCNFGAADFHFRAADVCCRAADPDFRIVHAAANNNGNTHASSLCHYVRDMMS